MAAGCCRLCTNRPRGRDVGPSKRILVLKPLREINTRIRVETTSGAIRYTFGSIRLTCTWKYVLGAFGFTVSVKPPTNSAPGVYRPSL